MIKKIIFILLLAVSIICYLILQKNNMPIMENNLNFNKLTDREVVDIKINDQIIKVEVVNTPKSTTLGLSGRDDIGQEGMLFIFPTSENRYFWMKDMKFDIDIVWIEDDQVVEITKNVPKPEENTPDNRLLTYSPNQNINMVLELNKAGAEKYNINPGDVVQLVQ